MFNEQKQKEWFRQGCPLSMEEKLITDEMRQAIARGKSHKGRDKVLLTAAYDEMRERCGQRKKVLNCSSCFTALNRQFKIWLSRYDARTPEQKKIAKRVIEGTYQIDTEKVLKGENPEGTLMTKKDRKKSLQDMDYFELLDLAEERLGDRFQELKKENGNRRNISAKILIQELL